MFCHRNKWVGLRRFASLMVLVLLSVAIGRAQDGTVTNLLAEGERVAEQGDLSGALAVYARAEAMTSINSAELCVLTRRYCDLMHDTASEDTQKKLARLALASAFAAVKADPKNATAHLCVAVSYVKNFPDANAETKVKWSRAIKTECETAIALDPKADVGYYLLGRWHAGIANMNFFYKGVVKLIYGGLPKASNEEAIRNFKKAIELAPDRIIHHAELAKSYEVTGQTKAALEEWTKCSVLKPVDRDDADAQQEALARLKEIRS